MFMDYLKEVVYMLYDIMNLNINIDGFNITIFGVMAFSVTTALFFNLIFGGKKDE